MQTFETGRIGTWNRNAFQLEALKHELIGTWSRNAFQFRFSNAFQFKAMKQAGLATKPEYVFEYISVGSIKTGLRYFQVRFGSLHWNRQNWRTKQKYVFKCVSVRSIETGIRCFQIRFRSLQWNTQNWRTKPEYVFKCVSVRSIKTERKIEKMYIGRIHETGMRFQICFSSKHWNRKNYVGNRNALKNWHAKPEYLSKCV